MYVFPIHASPLAFCAPLQPKQAASDDSGDRANSTDGGVPMAGVEVLQQAAEAGSWGSGPAAASGGAAPAGAAAAVAAAAAEAAAGGAAAAPPAQRPQRPQRAAQQRHASPEGSASGGKEESEEDEDEILDEDSEDDEPRSSRRPAKSDVRSTGTAGGWGLGACTCWAWACPFVPPHCVVQEPRARCRAALRCALLCRGLR